MDYQSIIKKYNTPFYLYDISELKSRVDMMKKYLPDICLCYAMKASPILAGFITDYVDRLEVCSPGEYEICIRDGISLISFLCQELIRLERVSIEYSS